tara:strand:- start:747 stop:950 length:204 start_codon:yes stop_codon:yes gene_type:complete
MEALIPVSSSSPLYGRGTGSALLQMRRNEPMTYAAQRLSLGPLALSALTLAVYGLGLVLQVATTISF